MDQNWKVLQEVFQGHKLEVEGKVKQEQQTNLLLMHHHLSPISYSKAKNANEEQLKESYSTSQSVIPIHRIDLIKQKLEKSEPLILISTQVIEAGTDLDFNVAVRDIGPIDSIVQTAGRCNRNGNCDTQSPFYSYRVVDEGGHQLAKKSIWIDIYWHH